jgi:DNA-binding LacI/PurR family transcriptional regulator
MVTLKEIAKQAGVNISTVSRALSGEKDISEKTRENIQEIAKRLNYRPNVTARILAGKGSRMVGIIVPEIDSNYFAKLIYSLEIHLKAKGFSLMIANTQYDIKAETAAIENFCNYNMDGIFLASSIHVENLEILHRVKTVRKIPIVLLEALIPHVDYSYVMIDDTYGLSRAISYLLEKGYQRVGLLSDYILDKIRGPMYREALLRNHLNPEENPVFSHPTERFEKAGYECMQKILNEKDFPKAFLAGYDDIAVGAIRAIEERGLNVPEDIAIIGNDNIRESSYLHRSLTTLSPPVDKMAELGVDLLLNSIKNSTEDEIHQIILKPELLIRETA